MFGSSRTARRGHATGGAMEVPGTHGHVSVNPNGHSTAPTHGHHTTTTRTSRSSGPARLAAKLMGGSRGTTSTHTTPAHTSHTTGTHHATTGTGTHMPLSMKIKRAMGMGPTAHTTTASRTHY